MKKFWGMVCLVAAIASVAAAQPVIRTDNGVLNASSYAADIARGSWFVIFGSGMGPAALAVYPAPPYQTTWSGTSVSFTPAAGGTAIAALLWYTSAGQLAGLLPSTAAAGDYDVRVTYNNGPPSAPYRVKVVERNFGYATQAQNGAGPAQATYGALDLNRFTTGTLAQWSLRPAKVGDTMVLWGTGVGADANSDLSGGTSGDQTAAGQVTVVVGGIEVTPAYAGRSGGSPGLDQINFKVPNVTPGCFVSLAVKAGGRTSNLGSIAIADAGKTACTDPRYTASQLSRLDQGGTLTIGGLSVIKSTVKVSVGGMSFDSITETASGSFFKYGVDQVGASGGYSITQDGACSIYRLTGTGTPSGSGTLVSLDEGPQLRLNGPNASNMAVPGATGSYSLTLYNTGFGGYGGSGTPTLVQGTYTLAGTGGADVGAFSASLDVPGSFVWTNLGSLANPIPRSTGMPITWTGGGAGLVTITGTSMLQTGGTAASPLYDISLFICTAQAPAGNFTVPSSVLQQLSAVPADSSTGAIGTLAVAAVSDPSKQGIFTAPLTVGGTLDQGTFSYSIGTTKSTGWQ